MPRMYACVEIVDGRVVESELDPIFKLAMRASFMAFMGLIGLLFGGGEFFEFISLSGVSILLAIGVIGSFKH